MPKRNGQTFSGLTGRTSGLPIELAANDGWSDRVLRPWSGQRQDGDAVRWFRQDLVLLSARWMNDAELERKAREVLRRSLARAAPTLANPYEDTLKMARQTGKAASL